MKVDFEAARQAQEIHMEEGKLMPGREGDRRAQAADQHLTL